MPIIILSTFPAARAIVYIHALIPTMGLQPHSRYKRKTAAAQPGAVMMVPEEKAVELEGATPPIVVCPSVTVVVPAVTVLWLTTTVGWT